MTSRRLFLLATGGAVLFAGLGVNAGSQARLDRRRLRFAIAQLEKKSGGQIGVSVLDTDSQQRFDWRGEQRFPMCSTFKLLLVGAVLKRVDGGDEELGRHIDIRKDELVSYSPVTEPLAGQGASVATLCEAAITRSDNTAANLLLESVGGPAGLTAFVRTLGDGMTRLDRNETSLNSAIPGDPRDTTTPSAMLGNLQALVLGPTLDAASRTLLVGWLVGNQTGGSRLRAGLPSSWRVGDKTGSGMNGTTNDVAIVWPPGRGPLLIASYITGSNLDSDGRDEVQKQMAQAMVLAMA